METRATGKEGSGSRAGATPVTTVYVVEFGAYSDRYVAGVFTNADEAAAWAYGQDGRCTEMKLDPPVSAKDKRVLRPGERAWRVRMRTNGQKASAEMIWREPTKGMVYRNLSSRHPADEGEALANECWATSARHAIKITNDQRVAWLARGKKLGKQNNYGWADCIY